MAVRFAKIGAHETVRIKVLAFPGVYIAGLGEMGYGDVVQVNRGDALFLLGASRAAIVEDEPEPIPAPEPQPVPELEPAPEPEKVEEVKPEAKFVKGGKKL